jgi:hypothetical protein
VLSAEQGRRTCPDRGYCQLRQLRELWPQGPGHWSLGAWPVACGYEVSPREPRTDGERRREELPREGKRRPKALTWENSREGRLGCLEGQHSRALKGHCFGTLGRGAALTETDFSIEVAGGEATKQKALRAMSPANRR